MDQSDISTSWSASAVCRDFPKTLLRGVGQVMFQDNAWTGLLFLSGIFWGAYASHTPLVGWGAVAGVASSTLAGYALGLKDMKGAQGLWGFNGALVGCAFPTFLGSTVWMWVALVLCAAMTTWVRSAFDSVMSRWGVSSLTFPFVFTTWVFLLAARQFHGIPTVGMADPTITFVTDPHITLGFGDLLKYWLNGVSEVFLIGNWVTGIFFLVALWISSPRAALWAAVASALSLFTAIVFGAPGSSVAGGLYSFSAVLTGIALGATFCGRGWKTALWTLTGIVATVFVQAAMNTFLAPLGLATLTGPFCITTWLFLFPSYKWLKQQ